MLTKFESNGLSPQIFICIFSIGDDIADFILHTNNPLQTHQQNGYAPLSAAARGGHLEIVKLLLDKGADMSAENNVSSAATWLS